MDTTCAHLDELDAWFSLALELPEPGVRRDVLLLLGGAGTVADIVSVTRDDCEAVGGYLIAYPGDGGRSLPLTPDFVDVTGLAPEDWPAERDHAADAAAVVDAIAAIDAALEEHTGTVRPGGAERLRELRLHAWLHELGPYAGVLTRCYGPDVLDLLGRNGSCPTRPDRDIADAGSHVGAVA